MSYETRKIVVVKTHARYPLKLMLEYESNQAYFYVEYKGEKIGLIQEKIGRAQSIYRGILKVLELGL